MTMREVYTAAWERSAIGTIAVTMLAVAVLVGLLFFFLPVVVWMVVGLFVVLLAVVVIAAVIDSFIVH